MDNEGNTHICNGCYDVAILHEKYGNWKIVDFRGFVLLYDITICPYCGMNLDEWHKEHKQEF